MIFESLMRSSTLWSYFKKRILRIYPGLLIVLTVGVLIGCIVTIQPIKNYFFDFAPYKYWFSEASLWFNSTDRIPGVFENNPYPQVLNTSLWTIVYEFTCYILISSLFFIKRKPCLLKIVLTLIFILFFLTYKFSLSIGGVWWMQPTNMDGRWLLYFGAFFFAGGMFAVFNARDFSYKNITVLICVILCITSLKIHHFNLAQFFVLPPIYILFGLQRTPWISGLSDKIGDLSYGIYLYGWLMQQTILHYWHLNYWQLFLCVMPILIICALLSWNLVEKRALELKYK